MDPDIRRLINRWGMAITLLLLAAIGIGSASLANGGSTQIVRAAAPAVSAPAGTTRTAPSSTPANASKTPAAYAGNSMFVERTTQDEYGNPVHLYSCAHGLTSVDVPLTGKGHGLNGMQATATATKDDAGNQGHVQLTLTLGKNVSVPGIILHANSSVGGINLESDSALAVHLTAGQSTYNLPTSAYVSDQVDGDQITYFTVCVEA